VDDIFTVKNAISGLKSSPWAGLGKTGQYTPGQFNFCWMISQPSILVFRFQIHCS